MTELRDYVAMKVTGKYGEMAEDLLRTVQQTESSLKRLKERQGAGSAQGENASASDADKICSQLYLDVQEYGKQLKKLGIEEDSAPEYQKLCLAVKL